MTGSGTEGDPYIIQDVNDLQDVDLDLTAYYELGNDIDATATITWNAGAGFSPIGLAAVSYFSGGFNGNNYTIKNLYINRPATDYVGLFRQIFYGGGVKPFTSLKLHGAVVIGNQYVGGLAGFTSYGNITKCNVSGLVWGNIVGGFAGGLGATSICSFIGSVLVTGGGGVTRRGGGFAGNISQTVADCFARGNISLLNAGLYGRVSGFADSLTASGYTRRCYASMEMGQYSSKYGFNYFFGSHVLGGCYWDKDTSGVTTSDGGIGKTIDQLRTQSTFEEGGDATYDFSTIWMMDTTFVNRGMPYHIPPPDPPFLEDKGSLWVEGTELHYIDETYHERSFEAAAGGASGQDTGQVWIEGTKFHYIDSAGNERSEEGTVTGNSDDAGQTWVEGTEFHYMDENDDERYIEGTLV